MFCKMDVDDLLRARLGMKPRLMACRCQVPPEPPRVDFGCFCPRCGAACKECSGFGHVRPPEKNFHQVMTRVRGLIGRHVRTRGQPPGFVRLAQDEVDALTRKRTVEADDHWIVDYVDLGPPLRLFDVIVVVDRRRKR